MNEDGGATLMNDNTCVDQQVERRRGMMIPSSSSLVETFADRLAHFLEVDEAVKAIWCEVLQEGVEDFPRHFYTLCSISPATTRMGFLTTAPRPFSLEYCFPLETHFSFFLHTFGHSYLHSSIGTFAGYVETNLRLNPESVSQFSSPLVFQHLFVQLMDIILFSSLEISEQLAETYGEVFSHTQAPSYSQVAFFLKTFFSNFVCGCLEQPQVCKKRQNTFPPSPPPPPPPFLLLPPLLPPPPPLFFHFSMFLTIPPLILSFLSFRWFFRFPFHLRR